MKRSRRPSLPWAVRRGIVGAYRLENRDPSLRAWPRQVAERLSKVPRAVWELDVDWRKDASTLDRCADQAVVDRTFSEEARTHKQIAAALRKARNLLRGDGQPDPLLAGTLDALARCYSDQFKPFRLTRQLTEDEPRLSDFLSSAADFIEGEQARHGGLHRMASELAGKGRQGAAIQAAASVRWFFETRTGKPHNDLMKEVVSAYFP